MVIQENFKYFVIIQIRIPPDTEDEADWVVRLDGLWAAGWMEGGVEGGSTNSAELWTIGWTCCIISLPSCIPKREEPSLSQQWLLLDELLFAFSSRLAETWWFFTLDDAELLDDCFVKLFILIHYNSYIIWNSSLIKKLIPRKRHLNNTHDFLTLQYFQP